MHIEAVVFDMNGVLVDSEPMYYASTNEVLAARGVFLEQDTYDRCRGMSESAFFALLVKRFDLDDDPEKLAEERNYVQIVTLTDRTRVAHAASDAWGTCLPVDVGFRGLCAGACVRRQQVAGRSRCGQAGDTETAWRRRQSRRCGAWEAAGGSVPGSGAPAAP